MPEMADTPAGRVLDAAIAIAADGKRRSSMTHANRSYICTCGKTVSGNGGKSSHRKACDGRYLSYVWETFSWLDES
jgi:hypothetical protein